MRRDRMSGGAASWALTFASALAVTTLTAAVAVAVAGCSSSSSASQPKAAPTPQRLQALAVATKEFGLMSGGGWGPAWDLWSAATQQVMTRSDFVRLNTECRPALGIPYVVDANSAANQDTVQVSWHRGDVKGTSTLTYQAGSWHFVPDDQTLADLRLGVDRLIQNRKAQGSCH